MSVDVQIYLLTIPVQHGQIQRSEIHIEILVLQLIVDTKIMDGRRLSRSTMEGHEVQATPDELAGVPQVHTVCVHFACGLV